MYVTSRFTSYAVGSDKYAVCNALSGEVAVLNRAGLELLQSLRSGEAPACGEHVLQQLRDARFLFDSAEAEREVFETLCRTAWESYCREAPRHFTLVVNTRCNFACPYCFEPASGRIKGSGLQTPQVEAAFRVIDQCAQAHHPPEVEVFGASHCCRVRAPSSSKSCPSWNSGTAAPRSKPTATTFTLISTSSPDTGSASASFR